MDMLNYKDRFINKIQVLRHNVHSLLSREVTFSPKPPKTTKNLLEWRRYDWRKPLYVQLCEFYEQSEGCDGSVPSRLYFEWKEEAYFITCRWLDITGQFIDSLKLGQIMPGNTIWHNCIIFPCSKRTRSTTVDQIYLELSNGNMEDTLKNVMERYSMDDDPCFKEIRNYITYGGQRLSEMVNYIRDVYFLYTETTYCNIFTRLLKRSDDEDIMYQNRDYLFIQSKRKAIQLFHTSHPYVRLSKWLDT